MKHIVRYQERVNESVGRGSVLFIKGKADDGGRKLFATHIEGYSEFKPGVRMFFLPQDFYRIKEVDGEVRALRVGLSDPALRAVLNIKSPGKVSIVQNNAKTPWHWKSLKHTSIGSAVRELEDEIKMGDYLLEQDQLDNEVKFDHLYNYIVKTVIKSAIFGEKNRDVIFTDYDVELGLQDAINGIAESDTVNSDWEAKFSCLYIGKEFRDELEHFDIGATFDVSLYFSSEAWVKVTHDPGDYHTPPDWDVDVTAIETKLDTDSVFLEGSSGRPTAELENLFNEVDRAVNELSDEDISSLIKQNVTIPNHLKKGE